MPAGDLRLLFLSRLCLPVLHGPEFGSAKNRRCDPMSLYLVGARNRSSCLLSTVTAATMRNGQENSITNCTRPRRLLEPTDPLPHTSEHARVLGGTPQLTPSPAWFRLALQLLSTC